MGRCQPLAGRGVYMNRRMVFYVAGQMVLVEAILMLLPLIVSIFYMEKCALAFVASILIALVLGLAMVLIFKPSNKVIYSKEGFIIVALSWVMLSLVGCLPFVISKEIPNFVDAFFETVSGFTTTGASILTSYEGLSHGIMFWRSFTHWVGGMGVLVLVMAVSPTSTDRSMHILRAEMPGPIVGKLVPRVRQTAKILYLIYVGLTVLEMGLLCLGGLSLYESCIYAFGSAGTGGFGIMSDSLASYSPYVQWVITIFLVLFAANFNIYFLILMRKFKTAFKSEELWTYLGIIIASITVVTVCIYPLYDGFWKSLRMAAFQVMSILSTTGFATADFTLWSPVAKAVLFILMFIGGCAGSTAGGLKISRVVTLFKSIRRELYRMIHPHSVGAVKLDGKKLDDDTIKGIGTYFSLYVFILISAFLLISFEPLSFEGKFTSVVACFNNIGPGFAEVGPMGSYASYSAFSKIVLSITMLLGRLEIYPLLFILMPSVWKRKSNA